jgi:tetratricopeptide (TPR) repeat protein
VGEAATELEAVVKQSPEHPQAPLLLADCRLQLGEWKRVIAILDPLLEKDPDNQAILYMIGTALMRDRQVERGQRVLDRILRKGDSAEAHLVLAIASREASDDLSAEKELRRALELNPSLPTANAILGELLVKMGDAPGAMEALRRELAANPNHFDANLLLALLLRQESRDDEARAHVEKALTLRPGDPGALYQLALVRIATGDLEAARKVLEPLVRESPDFTEAHVSLATVYYRLGRREDGNREQAIVQRLKAEQKAREDAERERQGASTRPTGPEE